MYTAERNRIVSECDEDNTIQSNSVLMQLLCNMRLSDIIICHLMTLASRIKKPHMHSYSMCALASHLFHHKVATKDYTRL